METKQHTLFGRAAIAASLLISGTASATLMLDLPDPLTNSIQYGDFYSYSLPILASDYDSLNGGGTGPGNPYYVTSTPGAIQDEIVVATGANGGPVNTNFSGMDDAYATPNSSGIPTFETGTVADPGTGGGGSDPIGDQLGTWDADLAAINNFLDGGELVWLFNNNQINSGDASNQNLFAWARVTVRDSTGALADIMFDFTNTNTGQDVTTYDSSGAAPASSDYVLSGGEICRDALGALQACDGTQAETINHNLGANQAVYAIVAPELNAGLLGWEASGYNTLSLDFRMDDLNNGYEQLFIVSNASQPTPTPPPEVPNPGTLLLFGIGLCALRFSRKQRA